MGKLLDFDPSLPLNEPARMAEAAGWRSGTRSGPGGGRGASTSISGTSSRIRSPGCSPEHPSIGFIGCNGTKSHAQLKRSAPELFAEARLTIVQLPSTSPAAAALRFEEKLAAWRAVGDFLQKSGDRD